MHSFSILKSHARLALFERTAQATCVVLFILVQLMSAAFGSTPPNVVHPTDKSNLSLPNAFNEGLIHSPRTASVRLQLGITKSQLIRATELPNPSIFMDNGYKAEFTYRYGITLPIEPPWKLILRVALAKNQIKQTNFEIIRALWFYRASVRTAYTNYVVAQELYRTLFELADLTEQLHQVARKRFDAGEVAELDVYRAEQEAAKGQANKEQQQFLLLEARQSLAVLLGRIPEDEISVPLLPPDGPPPTTSGILPVTDTAFPTIEKCLKLAMENRPDLKVVRQSLRTNSANLKLAVSNIIPNPTIGVGSSVVNGPALPADALPEDVGKNILHGFFFQVFQELPILNFQQGDLSQYKATGRQLQIEIKAQENIVTQEVVTAYQRMVGAKRKIEIYQDRLLARTLEIVRPARLGYEIANSNINDVLLAQQSAIAVKTEYLEAVAAYQLAFKDLEQSIGTPLQ